MPRPRWPPFGNNDSPITILLPMLLVLLLGYCQLTSSQSQCGQNGTCPMCSPGFYSNCSGQNCPQGSCRSASDCTPCAPGTFSSSCGELACGLCDEGKISPAGSNSCIPCTAGTFANVSQCSPCPVGSYSEGATSKCSPCGSGKYNPRTNSPSESYCIPCPPGYYCPSPFTQYPLICPARYFCEANAVKPTACRFLFVSQSCSTKCKPSTLLWALIALGAGFILVLVLLLIMKSTKSRMDREEKLNKEKETASLIPKPLPGPVYGGY